jgi:DNA polymerase I-like protein with 3'-5' exonuclease and polymerase domains
MDVSKLQEKKAALEEELQRTEENIYDLEGEYLQVRIRAVTSHKPR